MSEQRHEPCRRCDRYWADANSEYCTECLKTHPAWAPNLGCADVGCLLAHGNATEVTR